MIPPALAGALPETQAAWEAMENALAAYGVTMFMPEYGGVRSEADTTLILQYRQDDYNAALAKGQIAPDTTLQRFRPIAPWGKSYHDYGAAFDAEPMAWIAPMTKDKAYQLMGSLAPSLGLRWGGNFSNPDPNHFELDTTLAEAEAKWQNWQESGGTDDTLDAVQQVTVAAQNPLLWLAVGLGVVWVIFSGRRKLARAY